MATILLFSSQQTPLQTKDSHFINDIQNCKLYLYLRSSSRFMAFSFLQFPYNTGFFLNSWCHWKHQLTTKGKLLSIFYEDFVFLAFTVLIVLLSPTLADLSYVIPLSAVFSWKVRTQPLERRGWRDVTCFRAKAMRCVVWFWYFGGAVCVVISLNIQALGF